jgi:hypothetical protein
MWTKKDTLGIKRPILWKNWVLVWMAEKDVEVNLKNTQGDKK